MVIDRMIHLAFLRIIRDFSFFGMLGGLLYLPGP